MPFREHCAIAQLCSPAWAQQGERKLKLNLKSLFRIYLLPGILPDPFLQIIGRGYWNSRHSERTVSLGQERMLQRSQVCSELHKELDESTFFSVSFQLSWHVLLYALWDLIPSVHPAGSGWLSSKVLTTSPPRRGEWAPPLSNRPTVKTRRVVGKLTAVWWTFSWKPFYFAALTEEFLFSWERHKTKTVHFSLERSRNHLSAKSFPASTWKSSTIKLFDTGSQQLLNLCKEDQLYTHAHTCEQTHWGRCTVKPIKKKQTAWKIASARVSAIPGMRASREEAPHKQQVAYFIFLSMAFLLVLRTLSLHLMGCYWKDVLNKVL